MSKTFFETEIEFWPHTICFVGSDKELRIHLDKAKVESVWFSFNRMLIKDAKEIRDELLRKLPNDQYRVSVVDCEIIGHESQNALLKVIEEPSTGHKVIFRLSTLDGLLDTILSRSVLIQNKKNQESIADRELIEWVGLDKLERLKQAESWIKQAQKKQETGLLRTRILNMIIVLEKHIYASQHRSKHYDLLQELQNFREYLQNQGASPKYILEYLALSLPKS